MRASPQRLEALRRRLASIEDRAPSDASRFTLGIDRLDSALGGGLLRGGLHEVYAQAAGDVAAADGFGLGLGLRAAGDGYLAWIVQTMAVTEAGLPYGAGLQAWGADPARILFVRVRHATELLAAAEEALKSRALGAVIMSVWGSPRTLNLTTARRLALSAQSGTTAVLIRAAAEPAPSAAETRWSVRSVPSEPLEANAPGRPSLAARLLRARQGFEQSEWLMEWDCEAGGFDQPAAVFGGMVSLPADRPAAASGYGLRRAG